MLFYFQDQECSCQMYKHQSCTEACSTEGPDPKLGGDMRDSDTSIPLLVLVQTTDGKWPMVFRDTLWKQRACGYSWCLPMCTTLGDNYTPHPTLYYHLSNSLAALAELLTAFLHEGLESAGEEQRAAMLGGTKCACACRKGVRMSAELCGTYLQSSKRLTCSFLTKG